MARIAVAAASDAAQQLIEPERELACRSSRTCVVAVLCARPVNSGVMRLMIAMTLTGYQNKMSKRNEIFLRPSGVLIFGWGIGLMAMIAVVLLIWLSFSGFGEWSFNEVARVPHPNADLDAVLVETNGGATTSFGYEVFVLPRGQKPKRGGAIAYLYGAVRNQSAYGANLRWEAKDTLAVEYLEARHATLPNERVTVNGRAISVLMKAGINDLTAPPGGMLYNLQRRPEL